MTSSVLLGGLDAVPDPHDPTTVVWKTLKDVEARGKDSPLERISPLRQCSGMTPEASPSAFVRTVDPVMARPRRLGDSSARAPDGQAPCRR